MGVTRFRGQRFDLAVPPPGISRAAAVHLAPRPTRGSNTSAGRAKRTNRRRPAGPPRGGGPRSEPWSRGQLAALASSALSLSGLTMMLDANSPSRRAPGRSSLALATGRRLSSPTRCREGSGSECDGQALDSVVLGLRRLGGRRPPDPALAAGRLRRSTCPRSRTPCGFLSGTD